jgi:hypothetical protein
LTTSELGLRWPRSVRSQVDVGILLLMSPCVLFAQVIDFETVPGTTPAVGLVITDQFHESCGVRFSVSDGTGFFLGDYGGEFEGWIDDDEQPDVLLPEYDLGEFFAVYSGAATLGRYLVIEYEPPTEAAAFDILDVDDGPGNNPGYEEQWTVRAYGIGDSLLNVTVITAGDPGTGDASPTRYSIDLFGVHQIARIEVEYTGFAGTPGFGFDNFTASPMAGLPGEAASWGLLKALHRGHQETR